MTKAGAINKKAMSQLIEYRRNLLKASQEEVFPYVLNVCGMSLQIERGVFSPKWFESSALFCQMLPSMSGLRVLDMGCGCGVIAIRAAIDGATVADGVDIALEAVENTRHNAEKLGVSHVVRSWRSDLFNEMPADFKYDVIFWNPPWVYISPSYRHKSLLEMSVFDPGYRLLGRFLKGALRRLSTEGRILLGFADFGECEMLEQLACKFGYTVKELGRRVGRLPNSFTYLLYDMRPKIKSVH